MQVINSMLDQQHRQFNSKHTKAKVYRTNIDLVNNQQSSKLTPTKHARALNQANLPSQQMNKSLLNQLEILDKTRMGVDLNMPEKPILSRNGSIVHTGLSSQEYLNSSINEAAAKTKSSSMTKSVLGGPSQKSLKG